MLECQSKVVLYVCPKDLKYYMYVQQTLAEMLALR